MFIWTINDVIGIAVVALIVVGALVCWVWDKVERWQLKRRK